MTVSIFLMPSLLQANKTEDCFFLDSDGLGLNLRV